MHLETQSFYGRTLNPHSLNLSLGVSSGGVAALLVLKGPCMGMGRQVDQSDISSFSSILQTVMAEALSVVLSHSLVSATFVRRPVHSLWALSFGIKTAMMGRLFPVARCPGQRGSWSC
jgi:hypothetical protein